MVKSIKHKHDCLRVTTENFSEDKFTDHADLIIETKFSYCSVRVRRLGSGKYERALSCVEEIFFGRSNCTLGTGLQVYMSAAQLPADTYGSTGLRVEERQDRILSRDV